MPIHRNTKREDLEHHEANSKVVQPPALKLTSKPSDERQKEVIEEDMDIRSEVSSIDTWMSGVSYHSCPKNGATLNNDTMRAGMNQGNEHYQCTHCEKMFTNTYHLSSHLVTHTGERTFSCPKCAKSFGRRSTLRAHMTTHSKTSNFMCHVCEKACNDNNSLEEHIRYWIYGLYTLFLCNLYYY